MTVSQYVSQLNRLIETGETLAAMEQFYADGVTMQENSEAPRVGKNVCLAHERSNLAKVRFMKARLLNQAINTEQQTVFSEWKFVFTDLQNQSWQLTEVSVQQWQNGQIVRERFHYHSPTTVTHGRSVTAVRP